ncbi:DNA helicase [Tanacetum coccineum]
MVATGLFQQYVVGVFCVVEQNRVDFLRKKQNDILADYLSGLYDAISRGERDGYEVGGRIILPISFTGGPRYMYAHYLDALAIFQKLGNPQFFYHIHIANVVCRVFEQKIQSFVTFLKEERIFRNVIGDSESKIKSAEDVDQYISAKLPDPRIDPDRWSMLIKYLFKYISKGTDRIFAWVSRAMGESSTEAAPSREVVDEIQNYVEGRFICAHEAY